MATEVASLYASIGADTKDLNKGLADASRQLEKTAGEMRALDDAQGVAANGTDKLDGKVKLFNASLGAYMGLVGALAGATKVAFDFSEEGAAIEQTRQSFDRLGLSITEMRNASLGTIDDMTLMSSTLTLTAGASDELQGRLLQSAPRLMEIAKAANALNPALGDTAHMYESIATGIKRSSPLILDNLGIIVKVGEANETYAAQIGKTVAELTAEEKQIALLNATMEAGSRLIEQAGGDVASYGDAWAAVRVEIANTTDAMKAHAAEGLGPLVQRYGDFLRYSREQEQSLIGIGAMYRAATMMATDNADATHVVSIAWELLTGQYYDAHQHMQDLVHVTDQLNGKQENSGAAAKGAAASHKVLNDELERELILLNAMQSGSEGNRGLSSSISEYHNKIARAAYESADAVDQYNRAISEAESASSAYSTELHRAEVAAGREARAIELVAAVNSNLGDSMRESSMERQDLLVQRADMLAQLRELELANGTYITTQREATLTGHELALAEIDLAQAREKMADAEVGSEEYHKAAIQVEKLTAKIGEAGGAFTSMVDNGKAISELEGEIAGVTEQLNGLTGAAQSAVSAFVFQNLVGKLDLSNLTEAQTVLLESAAAAAGIDTAFLRINETVNNAINGAGGVDEFGNSTEAAMRQAELGADRLNNAVTNVARDTANIATTIAEPFQRAALAEREIGEEAEIAMPRVASLADVAIPRMTSVADVAGAAAALMIEIGNNANWAQSQIDAMHGKDIAVNLNITTHRNVGNTNNYHEDLNLIEPELSGGLASGGFAPIGTNWLVGEEGPELMSVGSAGATITPMSGGAGGSRIGGTTWNGNLIVQGADNPSATADAVLRKLQDRGMIPAGGFR